MYLTEVIFDELEEIKAQRSQKIIRTAEAVYKERPFPMKERAFSFIKYLKIRK